MRNALLVVAALATALAAVQPVNAGTGLACEAASGPTLPTLVELYTSEGCSSCPPAERWLSSLKDRPGVIALAFHVDYWDRLGWSDRYASRAGTARQYEVARRAGDGTVYTPQVLVGGQDWRGWPGLPAAGAASPVRLRLARAGQTVTAEVSRQKAADEQVAPAQLAGYWAVVEDGYDSRVRAGENAGATLHHDDVVRLYRPVAAWPAAVPQRLELQVSPGVAEHPRRVVFVVTDPATGRPLQALALGC
ncbi:MAG: DUF1223 domain-containing protein [Burkholderiales bacterium]|nr:DUF1223 domain-containing protein [Burkholderiales bacterium]